MGTLPLQQQDKGVWSIYLPGDQHGKYYDFTLTTPFGTCNAADPYARSAGVNGVRSMIFDPPGGPAGLGAGCAAVTHRPPQCVGGQRPGFLAGPGQRRAHGLAGQISGLYPAGHDPEQRRHPPYLPELPQAAGVSYVQLMPIFDFGSVDESRPLTRQYNWGYDPTNFNVLEGSYSTDPTRGEVRVRECKQMIAALHAAGIGVVMDVVYNHMVSFR